MDYPGTIQIETTAACNAACSFCPHSFREDLPVKIMPMDLIAKLIHEASTWPALGQFIPFLTNEPFADVRMPDIIALGNSKLPNARVVIFTNGSLFSERTIERLKAAGARIDEMFFSVHHSSAAEYHAELGIDFDKTLASIHRAIDSRIADKFTILRVSDYDTAKDARFKRFISQEFPGIPVQISYRYNWKGEIDGIIPYEHTLDKVCPRHTSFCVLADGRSARCCLDQDARYGYGDCNTHTMLELYNAELATSLRGKTKRLGGTPCDTCNMV